LSINEVDVENDDCFVGSNKHIISSFLDSLSVREGPVKIDIDSVEEEFPMDAEDSSPIEFQEEETGLQNSRQEIIQMEDQHFKPIPEP
jgi:hypothetical protein